MNLDEQCRPIFDALTRLTSNPNRDHAWWQDYNLICRMIVRGVIFTTDHLGEDPSALTNNR